jgi:hypothetical protein
LMQVLLDTAPILELARTCPLITELARDLLPLVTMQTPEGVAVL